MLPKYIIVAAICGSTLVSLPAFGQENPLSKADIGIEAAVPLAENTNSGGAQQGATVNYSFRGGYRVFLNKRSSVEPNYGYAHNIQMYSLYGGSIGLRKNPVEVLAAYVFRFPKKRWSPFALAGAGAPTFDRKTVAGASAQTGLGYPYGDGADFNLKHRIFPRTAHRGVFYNSATFDMGGLNSLDWMPNRVKPSVVFGYSFKR